MANDRAHLVRKRGVHGLGLRVRVRVRVRVRAWVRGTESAVRSGASTASSRPRVKSLAPMRMATLVRVWG